MRLAHCSDLHLLSMQGAKFLDFANKRWIGGLNLLVNRGRHHQTAVVKAMFEDFSRIKPDHVLVTGDITNLALDEEFRFARELFDQIDLGPSNITILPGNHDAYVQRGAEYFSRHFEPYFCSDEGWDWGDDDPWPTVRVREGVAIVSLSTSLQTPWFTAYGVMGAKQLDRCAQALADPRLGSCFRLLAIHHPPAGPPARSRVRGLRDRGELAKVLQSHGADLVLHGHEHRDMLHTLPGPVAPIEVRGIQSSSYDAGDSRQDKRARYRVFELVPSSGGKPAIVDVALRAWAPSEGRFVADRG